MPDITETLTAIDNTIRALCCPVEAQDYTDLGETPPVYLISNEQGDPLVEAQNLPEAVEGIVRLWDSESQRATTAEAEATRLKAGLEAAHDDQAASRERLAEVEKELDDLGAMVKTAAEDTKGYLALIEEMAAVVTAVRSVCPSDETTGVREKFLYVCHDEDGEPIVEANTLPEAVAQIIACWSQMAEQPSGIPQARYDGVREELMRKAQVLRAAEAERDQMRALLMTLMDVAQEASGYNQSYDFRPRAATAANAARAALAAKEGK